MFITELNSCVVRGLVVADVTADVRESVSVVQSVSIENCHMEIIS